jgi:hypothetical protein
MTVKHCKLEQSDRHKPAVTNEALEEEQRVKDRQDTAHIVSSPPAVPGLTDAS